MITEVQRATASAYCKAFVPQLPALLHVQLIRQADACLLRCMHVCRRTVLFGFGQVHTEPTADTLACSPEENVDKHCALWLSEAAVSPLCAKCSCAANHCNCLGS
jgi:hypothetical protein